MTLSVTAHQPQRLTFQNGEFVVDTAGAWTIQSLSYFETQAIMSVEGLDNIRATLEQGLVDCPGGREAFLACPSTQYVHPLYRAIWAHTSGN